jgi:hypothetical protein
MTTPEPLVLTDASGDTLDVDVSPAGNLAITVDEDGPATVLLDRDQARQLLRWLAAYLSEPAVADLPDNLGYVRCARCTVLFDPITGHHCAATDDEQVRGWLAGEATVTHVEGQPQ